MKYWHYFLFCLFANLHKVYPQTPHSPIHIIRYNDNFSFVKSDSAKRGVNTLKNMDLGKNVYISFGGELREQYQYFDNQNFGDVPPNVQKVSVGQLWHRTMLHSNLEIGAKTRIFIQLNSTFRLFNPNPIVPEIDENQLSLHQAFIDYSFNQQFMIRVGRQELGYGNNRILTFREGPNTRLTFDAAILKYKTNKRKIDLLAITPVVSKQYAFDDTSFEEYVWGIYGTEYLVPKKILLDYYLLNFSSDKRKYNFVAGKENRQVIGFRLFSQNPRLNYELEGTYQIGKFNQSKITAYGISSDVHYKIYPKLNLFLGLSANYISGDKDRNDDKLIPK